MGHVEWEVNRVGSDSYVQYLLAFVDKQSVSFNFITVLQLQIKLTSTGKELIGLG